MGDQRERERERERKGKRERDKKQENKRERDRERERQETMKYQHAVDSRAVLRDLRKREGEIKRANSPEAEAPRCFSGRRLYYSSLVHTVSPLHHPDH